MGVVLGLDCGGSNTRAVAADLEGNEVFRGQSGAANLSSTPPDTLARNLESALEHCPNPDAIAGCFAGLLTEEDRERAINLLQARFPGVPCRAEPDYVAAFMACPSGTDLAVLAGTGSLICSREPDGSFRKSGGGGYLLGDEGSAFAMGRDGVAALLLDGISGLARLRRALAKQFSLVLDDSAGSLNAALARIYRSGAPAAVVAKFAEFVVADARDGDPTAQEIVRANMEKLARRVVRHTNSSAAHLNLGLVGGVWKMGEPVIPAFEQAMRSARNGGTFTLARADRPPVEGALALARELLT